MSNDMLDLESLENMSDEEKIENFICPECGSELQQCKTGLKTYVPCGESYVVESEEVILKCSKCYWEED